ncbi:NAD(P)H-binding protein [Aequorivita viscosa]|nr:NAD(P)H-binding protein [Aequorivita viscosa]
MNTKHLVLGATGGIGFSYTAELLSHNIQTTILVRDKEKAIKLFNNNPLLEVIVGDVNNLGHLKEISANKEFIFLGINVPYQLWETQMEPIISNVIIAAKLNKATILFPENNYAFGKVDNPITESTLPQPSTKKGKLRLSLVNHLKKAAERNDCKVIIIRLPDFFGPNVTNALMKQIFLEAIHNKPIKWLINDAIPHQFAFTPDISKYFHRLTLETDLPNFFLINYSGITVSSMNHFSEKISAIQGNPKKVKVAPKFLLNMNALFDSEVRELKENFYQFENSILLVDDPLKNRYPEIKETTLDTALKITLDWYKKNVK